MTATQIREQVNRKYVTSKLMKFVTNLWSVFDGAHEDWTQTFTQHISLVFPRVIAHKNKMEILRVKLIHGQY